MCIFVVDPKVKNFAQVFMVLIVMQFRCLGGFEGLGGFKMDYDYDGFPKFFIFTSL